MKKLILQTEVFGSVMYFEPFPGEGFKLSSEKKRAEVFESRTIAKERAKELKKITGYKVDIKPL